MGVCFVKPKRLFTVKKVGRDETTISEGKLEITAIEIIYRYNNQDEVRWSFGGLRSYGFKDRILTFDAGSRCLAGEGKHFFRIKHSEKAFHLIEDGMRQISTGPATTPPFTQPDITKLIPPSLPEKNNRVRGIEDDHDGRDASPNPPSPGSKSSDENNSDTPPRISPRNQPSAGSGPEQGEGESSKERNTLNYAQIVFDEGDAQTEEQDSISAEQSSITKTPSPRPSHHSRFNSLPKGYTGGVPISPKARERFNTLPHRPSPSEGSPKARRASQLTSPYSTIDFDSTQALAKAKRETRPSSCPLESHHRVTPTCDDSNIFSTVHFSVR